MTNESEEENGCGLVLLSPSFLIFPFLDLSSFCALSPPSLLFSTAHHSSSLLLTFLPSSLIFPSQSFIHQATVYIHSPSEVRLGKNYSTSLFFQSFSHSPLRIFIVQTIKLIPSFGIYSLSFSFSFIFLSIHFSHPFSHHLPPSLSLLLFLPPSPSLLPPSSLFPYLTQRRENEECNTHGTKTHSLR